MKTFADVKRRMVPGAKLKLISHHRPHKYLDTVRTIVLRQTNAVQFEGGSWLDFPKAAQVTLLDADTFKISYQDVISVGPADGYLTYQFVEE